MPRKQTASTACGDRHVDVVAAARVRAPTGTTSRPRRPGRAWPPAPRRAISPRPSRSPKLRLRDSGELQVATRSPSPARPAKVSGSAPSYAQPGRLGQPAGDDRGERVVAEAHPRADAAGERDDVLHRAAELAADDVGVRVRAEVGVQHNSAPRRPGRSSTHATRWRWVAPWRSRGARFGPETTTIRSAGAGDLRDHLAHPLGGAELDALHQADQRGVARQAAPSRSGSRAATATGSRTRRGRRRPARRPGRGWRRRRGQVDVGQVVGVPCSGLIARRASPGGPRA